MNGRGTFFSVLRLPRFSLLAFGQTISQLGDKMNHMALIGLVGAVHAGADSGPALARLAVFFTLPVIMFGPVAGVLIDRWDRRNVLIFCDLSRTLLVASIPILYQWSGHLLSVYLIVFFIFLLGMVFNSAKMALIPDLVPRADLLAGNAVLAFIGRFATVIGIVFGGVIVGWSLWRRLGWQGYTVGFYLDALSYAVSVATLLLVRKGLPATKLRIPGKLASSPPSRGEILRQLRLAVIAVAVDIRDACRLARGIPDILFVLASVVILAVMTGSVYVLMIVIVQSLMQWGTEGIGYLGGITACGMILGSLVIGNLGRQADKRHLLLLGCAALGGMMALAAWAFSFITIASLAFLAGTLLAPVLIAQDTLLHERVPQSIRGRIFSIRELTLNASFALTAVLMGAGVTALGSFDVSHPYRVLLFLMGMAVMLAGVTGEAMLILVTRRLQVAPSALHSDSERSP